MAGKYSIARALYSLHPTCILSGWSTYCLHSVRNTLHISSYLMYDEVHPADCLCDFNSIGIKVFKFCIFFHLDKTSAACCLHSLNNSSPMNVHALTHYKPILCMGSEHFKTFSRIFKPHSELAVLPGVRDALALRVMLLHHV